jgi:hypothetical protein
MHHSYLEIGIIQILGLICVIFDYQKSYWRKNGKFLTLTIRNLNHLSCLEIKKGLQEQTPCKYSISYWALILAQVAASLLDGETAAMPSAFPNPWFTVDWMSSSCSATLKIATSSMTPLNIHAGAAGFSI